MKKEIRTKTTQVASQEIIDGQKFAESVASDVVDFIIEQDYRGYEPQPVRDLYEFIDIKDREIAEAFIDPRYSKIAEEFADAVEFAVNNDPKFKEMYPEGEYISKGIDIDYYGEMVANKPLLDLGPRAKEVAEHLLGIDEFPDWAKKQFLLDNSRGALAEAIMYCCSSFGGPLMGNFGDEGWGEYADTLEKEVRAFGWTFLEDIFDVIRNNELFPEGKDVQLYGEGEDDLFCVDDRLGVR